ncbi:hypothetical protein [Puia dinghuensis]|uniref:Uncharacterized protein n=1 Tax=Puia dinghuensis TaxID=1792502 RepID=A0A8J2XVJ8_9BACT|nr:hypothetical protein [Puia dinghuensis]GGB16216.1 hypothetical protein GCM10011511_45030 [Puia dinghuensis]
MKFRSLLILLIIGLALVPVYYLNRWLQGVMRPRESAGRFFLFLFSNFILIVVYTVLIVGLMVRLFGR